MEYQTLLRSLERFGTFLSAMVVTYFSAIYESGSSMICESDRNPCPIAFRFDDVQDEWLSDIQREVIKIFGMERVPLTLAVIGGYIGEDQALIDTIIAGGTTVAIENHGWDARNGPDGCSLLVSQPITTSINAIELANRKIFELFGTEPKVFIPHQFEYTDELAQALPSIGFTHISGADKLVRCEDGLKTKTSKPSCSPNLVYVPATVSFNWSASLGQTIKKVEEALTDLEVSFNYFGFAVFMLHPQDFATTNEQLDSENLEKLRVFLRHLAKLPERYSFAFVRDLAISHCQ